MAKNKKKNITAGDLFGRLGRSDEKKSKNRSVQDNVNNELDLLGESTDGNYRGDSIDLTRDGGDSELDIHELMKKYMPEYDSENPDGNQNDNEGKSGGLIAQLKNSVKSRDEKSDDELLINSLDFAFGIPDRPAETEKEMPISGSVYKDDDLTPDEPFLEELRQNSAKKYTEADTDNFEDRFLLDEEFGSDDYEDDLDEPLYENVEEEDSDNSVDEFVEVEDDEIYEPDEPADVKRNVFESIKSRSDEIIHEYELNHSDDTVLDNDDIQQITDNEHADAEEPDELDLFGEELNDEDVGDSAEIVDEVVDDNVEFADDMYADEEEEKKSIFSFFKKKKTKVKTTEKSENNQNEIIAENSGEDAAADSDTYDDSEETDAYSDKYEENFVDSAIEESYSDEDNSVESNDTDDVEEAGEGEFVGKAEEIDDEFDPTDINLMVAFGLDSGNNKDNKKAKEFGDKLEAKQHDYEAHKVKLDRPEFVDKSQAPKIKKEYHDKTVALGVKIVLCSVFTLLLLIFENIKFISKLFTGNEMQFAGVFDPALYPTVYIMVSLQLMLLACYCASEEIINGFKYLFRGTPKPESMTSLLTVAGIIYSIALTKLIESPNEPVMFNFATALSALLTLIYSLYNTKRERMNFAIIANKKPKHIVRRLRDEESEGESKAFAEQDDICDVMKIEKTDFIDGFFARLSKPDSTMSIFMTFSMSISVAIAVLFGFFVNFRGGHGADVCRVMYSTMLVLAPMSVYVTFSYPFYRANVAAKEYDSAIIGETSLEEYSYASIISFDDKNVFPSYSVKVQNIRIYNNARIDRVLYYASSVFAYAGGPLQDVFEVATKDMGCSNNVKIFDTEAGFLATQVDGVNIIFGSASVLRRRGLEIPENALQDDVDLSDELSIMYMFRESKLVAKMYIKYVMDADIDLILKQFSGSGLYVCVRTFDPNINERMIAKKAGMKKMPLKIVRYANAEEVGLYEEKVNSGLVTCGSPKSLLQVISYCGKVLHTKKTDVALGVLSVLIGIAGLVLLLVSNLFNLLTSIVVVLYHLLWLIPISIASKVYIR